MHTALPRRRGVLATPNKGSPQHLEEVAGARFALIGDKAPNHANIGACPGVLAAPHTCPGKTAVPCGIYVVSYNSSPILFVHVEIDRLGTNKRVFVSAIKIKVPTTH